MTPEIKQLMREVARDLFAGIAISSLIPVEDEQVLEGEQYVYGTGLLDTIKGQRYVIGEKLLKFRRNRKKKVKAFKHHRNYNPASIDKMIEPVGLPGSKERVDALCLQYAAAAPHEISPFYS